MDVEYGKTPGGLLRPLDEMKMGGRFVGQIIRKGEVIDEFDVANMVVNQGLDSILDVYFRASAHPGAWHVGIFQGNYTPVATVTAATIVGAAVECVDYSEATRPVWTPGAVATRQVSNSASRAQFTFTASRTLYGAFLVSAAGKSATTGVLAAAATFGGPRAVVADDQLLLAYNLTASTA